jgi:hypothetical protein
VAFNYHGYPPFNWVAGERVAQQARLGDFVTAEGLPWKFGHNNPSLLALFLAGARPGGPVQAVTSRSVFDYHDFTVRPTAELKWETFTYLAHGAQCTIVDKAYYEGRLDPLVFERIGEVFGEAQTKREFFGHKPRPEVGLYFSARSRDWFGREDPTRYTAAFFGAHKALVQSHIPMGMIVDENVTAARLKEYPVVYLPQLAILTGREAGLFEQYVAGGGNLLATGLPGQFDQHGHPIKISSLQKLLGARLVSRQSEFADNYLRLPAKLAEGEGRFLLQDLRADWPLLTWGPLGIYESTGAETFGELLVARRTKDNPWQGRMSPANVVGPAVFIHRHGQGKIVFVPCALDAAFIGDYRMPEHRQLIRNLVRYLHPQPEALIAAPLNVEAIVTRDETRNRLLMHLVSFWGPATASAAVFPQGGRVLPTQMEEAMPYEASIQLNRAFTRATAAGADTKILRQESTVRLQTANVHEVIVFEF